MIVAIAGLASSGKSLVAEYLRDTHGFRIVSFADPLKRIVQQLWGFTDEQLWGPSSKRSEPHPSVRMPNGEPLTARRALQVVGTDAARSLDQNVWVRAAIASIRPGEDVAIPDARYSNELAAVRAAGGYLIKRRPCVAPTPAEVDAMHVSERELYEEPDSSFDAVLGYYHDKRHLQNAVDVLVSGWRARSEVA